MVYIDETISVADGIIYSIMYTYIYRSRHPNWLEGGWIVSNVLVEDHASWGAH